MKTLVLIAISTLLLILQSKSGKLKNALPFGSKEKILKVRELPDIPEFQLKDGTYFDVGSLYTKSQFLWLGISYGNTEYVGFIDSQFKYVPLGKEEFKNIAELAKIELPFEAKISFFDSYISRPLLLLLLTASLVCGIRFHRQRKKLIEAVQQEELPVWPPSIQE